MQTAATLSRELPLKTRERVVLYSARGRIRALRDFVEQYSSLLNEIERRVLSERQRDLAGSPPSALRGPVTRSERLHDGGSTMSAVRRGARSAYIPALGVKLKGCRPEPTTFPAWDVDHEDRIRVKRIPFGVLSPESVMREVLGFCYVRHLGLQPTSIPVAVLEYSDVPTDGRFALVSRQIHDQRVETRLRCRGLTLHGLLRLHAARDESSALGGEAHLAGIDTPRYVDAKTDWLAAMNLGGAFRGILNSNLGNDVVKDQAFVGLCDFDTFTIRPMPAAGDGSALCRFVRQAILELIKTSLPFIDFVDLGARAATDAGVVLAKYYRSHSSVYCAYLPKLVAGLDRLGWRRSLVEDEVEAAFAMPAAGELLKELIPNSLTFQEFRADSWYVAHG
jgi:hypothetical protein